MRAITAARHAWGFAQLPRPVALFYLRACLHAARNRDRFSIRAATKPRELRLLLKLAVGRRHVVEVGTGSAWTAAALATADPERRVVTFDRIVRPHRDTYLRACDPAARRRIELVDRPAEATDPAPPAADAVELLYIDGSHRAPSIVATFEAWRPRLAPGAVVAFHDWDNPAYPGVREAIELLGLRGHGLGDLFVWRAPGMPASGSGRYELPRRKMTPRALAVYVRELALLPRAVAVFYVRARLRALRRRDHWSALVASKPRELRGLIDAGRDAERVVEVGTATGWSAIALALAHPTRRVVTFDVQRARERASYLELCDRDAARRIEFVHAEAKRGAREYDGEVDLLFLDGEHDRDNTIAVFQAWRPHLAPGAVVAFHDWGEPAFPGVEQATEALGLEGQAIGHIFVWRAPAR